MNTHKICFHGEIRYVFMEKYSENKLRINQEILFAAVRKCITHRGTSNEYPQDMFSWRNKICFHGEIRYSYISIWISSYLILCNITDLLH